MFNLTRDMIFEEKEIYKGNVYRYTSDLQTLVNDGDFMLMSCVTPTNGEAVLTLSNLSKSGDEILIELIEGGTLTETGMSALTGINLNRDYPDLTTVDCKVGLSSAGCSISGGTVLDVQLVGGVSRAREQNQGILLTPTVFKLKPNTRYTIKVTVSGSNTKILLSVDMLYRN